MSLSIELVTLSMKDMKGLLELFEVLKSVDPISEVLS